MSSVQDAPAALKWMADKSEAPGSARLQVLLESHFDFIWRMLRRLGLNASDADDLSQEAFLVLARKLVQVEIGKERAFLFAVAANLRRKFLHERGRAQELDPHLPTLEQDAPDVRFDAARARQQLDGVLNAIPEELRLVFVLHEIEGETMAAIAEFLALKPGTVASRLRRARQEFQSLTRKLRLASGALK